MALLSVIVPIYNSEKYLKKCIDSILSQTLYEIELLLVDDGSTDGSGLICEEAEKKDSRVVYIKKEHTGPIDTRRVGLNHSTSNYITYVDSDDWIEIDSFERMKPYMCEEIDVIKYCIVVDFNDRDSAIKKNTYKKGKYLRKQIETEIFPTLVWSVKNESEGVSSSLCDKIIKKEILEKSFSLAVGLDYHYCEDSTITFPMYRWVESLIITDEVLYHHCKYDQGMSSYIKSIDYFDNLYKWYKHLMNNMDYIDNYVRQIEEIYVAAMYPRLLMYEDRPDKVNRMFPFKKVSPNSKVVIWGYGVVGRTYVRQLCMSDYCQKTWIVDRNWKEYTEDGVMAPQKVIELKADYIVIAIWKDDIRNSVKNELISWGIDEKKIIW